MQRNNIIVLTGKEAPECYGSFKKCCEFNYLPYHSLKKVKLPIQWKEFKIFKVPFL